MLSFLLQKLRVVLLKLLELTVLRRVQILVLHFQRAFAAGLVPLDAHLDLLPKDRNCLLQDVSPVHNRLEPGTGFLGVGWSLGLLVELRLGLGLVFGIGDTLVVRVEL